MRDYWIFISLGLFFWRDVSVVGFLDEGLLVSDLYRNHWCYIVSVVGFLDEGLLG
ncbi:Uncharacterised protein [Legionella pneumophila]|nr:Uncharacterised protein [Legionella pneumophila]